MKKALINILKFVLPLCLGVFLIWYIYRGLSEADKQNIFLSFKTADYKWIVFSGILGIFSHLSRAHRWLLLLDTLGYKSRLSNSFYSVMIGYLANMAFPRLGEVTRCGVMGKYEKIPFDKLFGSVLAERLLDMIMLLLFCIITIVTQWSILADFVKEGFLNSFYEKLTADKGNKIFWIGIIGLSIFIGFSIAFYVFRSKAQSLFQKIKNALSGFAEGFKTVMNVKKKKLFLLHTLLIWTLYYSMLYISIFTLPETSNLSFGAVLSAFVFGSIGIIAVQGGIGAYPVLIMQTLMLYGISKSAGFAFGWISWAGQTAMILLLGVFSLVMISSNNKLSYDKSRNHQS